MQLLQFDAVPLSTSSRTQVKEFSEDTAPIRVLITIVFRTDAGSEVGVGYAQNKRFLAKEAAS